MSFTIDAELRTFLLEDPTIKATVKTRIFPGGRLPLEKGDITDHLPAITILDIPGRGTITSPAGLICYRKIRYQIETWATLLQDAKCLSDNIRSRIDGFRGEMGERQIGGVFSRLSQAPQFQSDVKLWRVITDYMINVIK